MRLPRIAVSAAAAAAVLAGVLTGSAGSPASAEGVAPRPIVTGWFGWWLDSTASTPVDSDVQRLIDDADGVVPEVNIFWWAFAGAGTPLCTYDSGDYDGNNVWGDCLDGSATPWTNRALDRNRVALQAAGVKVFASITDLGSARAGQLSAYLATDANRKAYAAQIADWADRAGVDGVDLDWENFAFNDGSSTWSTTKPRWVATIQELSSALHAKGLELSATVPGGSPVFRSDGTPYDSSTYWVYAWSEIASYVDRLRIMAYDYSWSSPGPIGPNDWATDVARAAVMQMGDENAWKITIGQPQYGRDWIRKNSDGTWKTVGTCPSGWAPKARWSTPTPAGAKKLYAGLTADRIQREMDWSSKYGEWSFRYTGTATSSSGVSCTVAREVWFGDTRSALARARAVPTTGIGGIAIWNLGDVESDFYTRLADYGRLIATPTTIATTQSSQVVVAGSPVTLTSTVTNGNGPIAGAEARLMWRPAGEQDAVLAATGTTDETGVVTFTQTPSTSGSWTVEVASTWQWLGGVSETPIPVSVRATISAPVATTTSPARSESVGITAYVTPARAGMKVDLRRWTRDGYVTVGSYLTGKKGRVVAKVVFVKRVRYRFYVVPSDLNLGSRSAAVVLARSS